MKVRPKPRQTEQNARKKAKNPLARPSESLRNKSIPPPTLGLIKNENITMMPPASASVMENWFPTTTGARVRGGSIKRQKISETAVLSGWSYKAGSTERMFAADAENIFDITTVSDADTIPTDPVVMGQAAGYYSTQQFSTAGGDFLVAVNGADVAWQFDGTDWYPVNAAAVNALAYDGGSAAFVRGETVTGAGGASATIVAINGDATSGTLYIGPVTSGPFVDDEVLTGSVAGAAVANGAESSLSTVTITGVATSDLSQVWSFANRLWFVEDGTKRAWYLPVDSIGGAASAFSLAGVFRLGGSLLMGSSWSQDAGDGLDDYCVFVSTEGEVAVYQGSDPSSASTWSKVGVYRIGKPLGIKGLMHAGGDLLIATNIGLVSISEAISKDIKALAMTGASRQIQPLWLDAVADRGGLPWEVMRWDKRSMMIVSQPRSGIEYPAGCYVANMETGAWGYYTGWDTRCLISYADAVFFGANDGNVYEMEVGGRDDGAPYVCAYMSQFDHLDMPGVQKTALQARAVFKSSGTFNYRLSASVDYVENLPSPPNSTPDTTASLWDVGLWDSAIWNDNSAAIVSNKWVSIGRTGFSHAVQIQITCGTSQRPNIEMLALDLTYVPGAVVT